MDVRPTLTKLVAAAALVSLGGGCAGAGFWKKKDGWVTPEGVPVAPMSPDVKAGDKGVVQAGGIASSAAALGSSVPPALSWMTGKGDKAAKGQATSIFVWWRNKIDYLPDPTRDGAMGPGLVGQIFLLNARDLPATADGTLTVDLFDETPRPAGRPSIKPERWQFTKDVLKGLRTMDERFGPSYAVFLPWPTYRPDVTRVRIKARFDPEQGFPLYAEETKITLDTTASGGPGAEIGAVGATRTAGSQPSGPGPGLGVFVMGSGPKPQAPVGTPVGTLPPAPPGYGTLPPAGPGATGTPLTPGTLPPLSTVVPGSR